MDISITVPQKEADIWRRENSEAIKKNMDLYFKVPFIPKNSNPGDKCFVIINNRIEGYHIIKGFDRRSELECEITGREWGPGNYIVRKAKTWKEISQHLYIPAKPHRGFRYVDVRIPIRIIRM